MRSTATLATAAVLFVASTALGAAQQGAGALAPQSHIYLVGELRVTQPALVAGADAAPGTPMAVVFEVENRSKVADRLVGASLVGGGTLTMKNGDTPAANDGLLVPGNGTLALTIGGPHLEASGLGTVSSTTPPLSGELRFARAGLLRVSFEPAAAPPPPAEFEQQNPSVDLAH